MPEAKFEQISISELARILRVDRRTVAKRLRGLGEEATIEQIIGALITSDGIEEARRRKVLAEAESREIKLQQEKGNLLAKKAVIETLVKVLTWYRMEVAVHFPGRVAGMLVGRTEREIQVILARELGAIFNAGPNHANIFGGNAAGVPARRANGVGVGRQKPATVGRQLRRAR